jgi:hypothetical protein
MARTKQTARQTTGLNAARDPALAAQTVASNEPVQTEASTFHTELSSLTTHNYQPSSGPAFFTHFTADNT